MFHLRTLVEDLWWARKLASTLLRDKREPKHFSIAGADKKWHWAEAKIVGEKVILSSKEVKKPVAARYAFTMNPADANLYNIDGLPAGPFRTDDW